MSNSDDLTKYDLARASRMAAAYARDGWTFEETIVELPHWFGRQLTANEALSALTAFDTAQARAREQVADGVVAG